MATPSRDGTMALHKQHEIATAWDDFIKSKLHEQYAPDSAATWWRTLDMLKQFIIKEERFPSTNATDDKERFLAEFYVTNDENEGYVARMKLFIRAQQDRDKSVM